MSMMEIGSLAGAVLSGTWLLLCGLAGIRERIEKKRKEKQDKDYAERWSVWGDITALPRP